MKEDAEIRARALELALSQVKPGEKFGPVARLADVYARYIAGGEAAAMVTNIPEMTRTPSAPREEYLAREEYLPDV